VRHYFPVFAVLGGVLMLFSLTMTVPLAVAFVWHDAGEGAYAGSMFMTFTAGAALFFGCRRPRRELQPRDGFLLVTLVWTVLPAFATLPLLFHLKDLSFTDAYFETMSGLTTTGSTVLTGLDDLPLSINVWRHLLVWIGGMGILVLAVAILPLLGVGGAQAFKAESTGPLKENKLTPRIRETAKGLYAVYFALSLACFLAYAAAGMTWRDAFMVMCSTMGLGGFSSYDASYGHFNSLAIEVVAICFMLASGINFITHFSALRGRSLQPYRRDPEARLFIGVTVGSGVLIAVYLYFLGVYEDPLVALRYAMFNTISVATTTGFASTDYGAWPMFAGLWLLFLSSFATCAGSTGGGIKIVRAAILYQQVYREFVRILHPYAVTQVKVGGAVVQNNIVFAVLAFLFVYIATIVITTLLLVATNLDVVTAFSAAVACVNNTGPGLADVGPATTYAGLTDFQTWVCTFAMLLGRLELFTLLIVFTPVFWRK
jgi:trk system potassium uptake protein TrkH